MHVSTKRQIGLTCMLVLFPCQGTACTRRLWAPLQCFAVLMLGCMFICKVKIWCQRLLCRPAGMTEQWIPLRPPVSYRKMHGRSAIVV